MGPDYRCHVLLNSPQALCLSSQPLSTSSCLLLILSMSPKPFLLSHLPVVFNSSKKIKHKRSQRSTYSPPVRFLVSISSPGHGLPHILTTQRGPPVHLLTFPFLLFLLCGQSILPLCSLTQSPLHNLSPHKKKLNPDSPQEVVTSLWF